MKNCLALRPWEPTHGVHSRTAKFTEEQIREIRNRTEPVKVLCQRYGVANSVIYNILNRRTYREVKD